MRRLAAIPAFALLLALPLWAQHGGGHAGGGGGHMGGGAGFSGGHSSGFSGAGHAGGFSSGGTGVHAYSGPQSRSVAPRSFSRPSSSLSSGALTIIEKLLTAFLSASDFSEQIQQHPHNLQVPHHHRTRQLLLRLRLSRLRLLLSVGVRLLQSLLAMGFRFVQ